ncbi:Proline-rich protein 2, partial [Cucurbita argyrosperma subsp. sororia]
MRNPSLFGRTPLLCFFLVSFVFAATLCYADAKTVEVVGVGECAGCKESNIKTSHALSGLKVGIACKSTDGHFKTRGIGELNEEGKFKVLLPNAIVKDEKLKEECYAQLYSASATPCPAHHDLPSSKLILLSKSDQTHTFGLSGNLKFSPQTCTSAFLWPSFKYPPLPNFPHFPLPLPLIPKFHHPYFKHFVHPFYKKPTPPPVPIYKKPNPPPVYKKPLPPPVPVYKKPLPPPVHVYKKPLPPPVPAYKKPLPPVPVYKKPLPPPVPIYKPPIPKILPPPSPIPFLKPKHPFFKHLPPIPKIPHHPFLKKPWPPIPHFPPLPNFPPKYFSHHKFGGFPKHPPSASHH